MAQITINNLTTQSSGFSDFWIPVCDNNGNTYKVKVKDLIAGSGASSASVAPIVKTTTVVPKFKGWGFPAYRVFDEAAINETNMFASSTVVSGMIGGVSISKAAGSSTVVFGNANATVNGARVSLQSSSFGTVSVPNRFGKGGGTTTSATVHITCTTNSLKVESNAPVNVVLNIYKAG